MNIGQEVFAIKLYELEQQYGKLQSRIRVCGRESRKRIREELQKIAEEYEEEHLLLQERVKNCRSRAVSRLAKAQLDYQKATDEIVKEQLAADLHGENTTPGEDDQEASALYAEFAIDFATLSMQQALMAALSALDRQTEDTVKETERVKPEDDICKK